MDDATRKNNQIVQDAINRLSQEILLLKERAQMSENEILNLKAELANSKQLMGHMLGRGMGSTA
ncbi:MAG: hypothetical protein KJO69_06450 [Gammaproteobacteria bacterium]|nr:hypothetical protein [Gammaproteobacteria bacterium]